LIITIRGDFFSGRRFAVSIGALRPAGLIAGAAIFLRVRSLQCSGGGIESTGEYM
jgi:hypothetical protein